MHTLPSSLTIDTDPHKTVDARGLAVHGSSIRYTGYVPVTRPPCRERSHDGRWVPEQSERYAIRHAVDTEHT
jgi:hypothetical protein